MKHTIVLLVTAASPLLAQAPAPSAANPGVSAAREIWTINRDYLVRAAERMPEANYAFRPTPEVRTFGQLIGHVAGAQYMFCAAALGEPPRGEDDIEKTRTAKAALVEALKASNEYCMRAYNQTDAAASAMTKLFGADRSRMYALVMNAAHDGEHYGNIVTYMRIKGMVPPSSQRGQ